MRRAFPRSRVALASVVGLLVLIGCTQQGGGETLGEPGDESEIDRTITVTADEFSFSEESIEVTKGETIEFVITNEGLSPHEFALGALHEHQGGTHHDPSTGGTGAIPPGEESTLVWTFTKAGETSFACYIDGHDKQGMTGTLTVSG